MRMNRTGAGGRSASIARHSRSVALATRSCGGPKTPRRVEVVPEAGDDGVAAEQVPLQLVVPERQQARLDEGEVGIAGDICRELPARPDDGANPDAAAQELLQHAPTGAACAADQEHRLLRGHADASSGTTGPGSLEGRAATPLRV